MDNITQAKKIIKEIIYMNLGTVCPDGNPWNSPVYCAHDEEYNFYWISWHKNQHSINIKNNPETFVTIYDSTSPEGTGVGVYMKGKSYEISNPVEMLKAVKVSYARKSKKQRAVKEFLKKFPRRVYKFTPEKLWLNGDGDIEGNFVDIRVEVPLDQLKN